jgi:hypothetical protein
MKYTAIARGRYRGQHLRPGILVEIAERDVEAMLGRGLIAETASFEPPEKAVKPAPKKKSPGKKKTSKEKEE